MFHIFSDSAAKVNIFIQIKLLSENDLIICVFENLHQQISREKFEPEPELELRI